MLIQDVLESGELAKLAYFNDIVVGAVCCRVDMQGAGRKVLTEDTIYLDFSRSNFQNQSNLELSIAALHNDPGVPGALQTTWYRYADA